jgi:hypothetical protein
MVNQSSYPSATAMALTPTGGFLRGRPVGPPARVAAPQSKIDPARLAAPSDPSPYGTPFNPVAVFS